MGVQPQSILVDSLSIMYILLQNLMPTFSSQDLFPHFSHESCTLMAEDMVDDGPILHPFSGFESVENGLYTAPWEEDSGQRSDRHGYIYGRL